METRHYTVYKFEELTEEQKEKAIQRYYDINVDHDWWDCIYEGAKEIGLELEGFDLGSRQSCEGRLIEEPLTVIKKILTEYGKTCGVYKTAKQYEKVLKRLDKARNKETGMTAVQELEYEDSESGLLHDLLEDYRIMLREEYEYLTGREAIVETIKANEYDFTDDGKID